MQALSQTELQPQITTKIIKITLRKIWGSLDYHKIYLDKSRQPRVSLKNIMLNIRYNDNVGFENLRKYIILP